MLLNEDYFKDIEITDEDIINDDSAKSTGNDTQNPELLKQRLISSYQKCIKVRYSCNRNPITVNEFFTVLHKILKRIHYVLDLYNAEYETYLADSTIGYSNFNKMHIYNINGYNVLSTYKTEKRLKKEWNDGLNIIIFVNFPAFSYKQAYNFCTALTNSLWKDFQVPEYIYSSMLLIYQNPKYVFNNGIDDGHYTFSTTIHNYCSCFAPINGKAYRKYIRGILMLFFPGRTKNVLEIMNNITKGIEPF